MSKLKVLSGLKTKKHENENISWTLSLQLDNFIARGQGLNKGNQKFSFLPPHFLNETKYFKYAMQE